MKQWDLKCNRNADVCDNHFTVPVAPVTCLGCGNGAGDQKTVFSLLCLSPQPRP